MRTLVIAPHPDDETLGCGGTLLRQKKEGDALHWLIATAMDERFTEEQHAVREAEIESVRERYAFEAVHALGLPTTRLDEMPMTALVGKFAAVIQSVQPEQVFLPHRGDAHGDHKCVFDAATACLKWFRAPSIRRVLVYETPSETGFGLDPAAAEFSPNVFVNIEEFLEEKLEVLRLYPGEVGEFPFPRSEGAVRALAAWRGSLCGRRAAEAFCLLKEIL